MTERERLPGTGRLERRAEELGRLRGSVDADTLSDEQTEATGEISTVDNHPADVSDFTFQRELDSTVAQILADEEQQVRRALDAKAQGTYGVCEDCGRPIDPARLQARPEATRCVECQRRRETENPADHGADLQGVDRGV